MIDKNLKTEYDDHGNKIHYVTMSALGRLIEVWVKYNYSNLKSIDATVYQIKFEDGHIRQWMEKN